MAILTFRSKTHYTAKIDSLRKVMVNCTLLFPEAWTTVTITVVDVDASPVMVQEVTLPLKVHLTDWMLLSALVDQTISSVLTAGRPPVIATWKVGEELTGLLIN